ncbi:MAG: hypothetical protein ACD_65C00223G0002 [uncultured bacterium]|nr:MAG: hypothetical protein ACD_65C00223G0002 [uncultured bacterium]
MYYFTLFINYLFQILTFLVIVRVILSWFRAPRTGPLYNFINESTEPVMRIAKKITPKTGMLDFSPIVAIIGLNLLQEAILYLITYAS